MIGGLIPSGSTFAGTFGCKTGTPRKTLLKDAEDATDLVLLASARAGKQRRGDTGAAKTR